MSLYHMREYLWQKVVIRWTGHPRDQSCTEDLSHSPPDVTLKDVMTRLEPIVVKLQGLMIWDQPYHSMVALIAFNCLYWLFVWFNRFSFYSYLAIALFCIYFLILWTQYIWPEIRVPPNPSTDTEGWTPVHPNVLSAPEINHYINELCVMSRAVILWFIRLRREKRFKFFITTTSILFMTAIIGRLVPGVLIVYSISKC
ncbi:unnamed protein product [Oppiella nova]|uniref:RETREG1-3/ARL6IP-like N-terminal reticulon-homology domain-containing protein n=1 Tax=Oppiella nova TaxID=334625 RepID=A0A7R9MF20_9ACAR|nr:unnamed protein product [Oppiella nova]CAG2176194.1 unnamed protein product [Oppiella nova]